MQAAEMEMANSKKLQEDIWTQSVAATRLPQVQDSGATFPVWQAKKECRVSNGLPPSLYVFPHLCIMSRKVCGLPPLSQACSHSVLRHLAASFMVSPLKGRKELICPASLAYQTIRAISAQSSPFIFLDSEVWTSPLFGCPQSYWSVWIVASRNL